MSAAQPNLSPSTPVPRSGRNRADGHLVAMQSHWKARRTLPPMAKLATALGLRSSAGAFGVVARLTDAGCLQRVDRRIAPTRRFFGRPVLGHVCATVPPLAQEARIEVLTLDDYLVDDPARTSLHRVRGDSMRNAGIFDGDLAVVEDRAPTQVGDIVLAVVDRGPAIKRLAVDSKKRFYLDPANATFKAIHRTTSLELMGVVVGVVRRTRR